MKVIKEISLGLIIIVALVGNGFLMGQNVWDASSVATTTATGDVGIGTSSPLFDLHIIGSSTMGTALIAPNETGNGDDAQLRLAEDHDGTFGMRWVYDGGANRMYAYGFSGSSNYGPHIAINRNNGRVGIGTASPSSELHVRNSSNKATLILDGGTGSNTAEYKLSWSGAEKAHLTYAGDLNHLRLGTVGSTHIAFYPGLVEKMRIESGTGNVGIGTTTPQEKLDVNGTTRTKVIQITGGADFAESFHIMSTEPVEPGMVACIDPEQQGQLRISGKAYDTTVAGIVSGAGGVNPGLLMSQSNSDLHGEYSVALAGRVYCRADASNRAIKPGDLLTTSDIPGHAMKVTDYTKAQGTIIGKAMNSLAEGRGLVLVLVTLQ